MSAFSPESGARPLVVKDLVLPVPTNWTVEEPKQKGVRVDVGLLFAVEAADEDVFVRTHKAPRFEGRLLVECEPLEGALTPYFDERMAQFTKNIPSARVVRHEAIDLAGNEAILREHLLTGPGAALYRQRLVATSHEGTAYILGMTNTAGAVFDAAVRLFDECLEHASWRLDSED